MTDTANPNVSAETEGPRAQYAGSDWLKGCGKAVSPAGERAADLIGWWVRGIYHIEKDALRADWSHPVTITMTVRVDGWATYDWDMWTRLVIGAHDRAIRVEIEAVAPKLMRLWISPRQREGHMFERHPTFEAAIEAARRDGA